jgi:hypothetical protein
MNILKNIGLGLLFFAGIQAATASAETLNFSFTGYQESIDFHAYGIGTFTFPDGLTNVGLADLTSFSYTDLDVFLNTNPVGPNPPATLSYVYHFGIPDLKTFSLALNGTTPIDFTMATVPQPNNYVDGSLRVLDHLYPTGPDSFWAMDGGAAGTVVFSNQAPSFPAPEPSSFAFTGFALFVFLAFGRREVRKAGCARTEGLAGLTAVRSR